jgi:hypothetical protein
MLVRIEFHGGCKDGAVILGVDALNLGLEKNPAHMYLSFTEGGRVGTTFREPLPQEIRQAQNREYQEKAAEAMRLGKPVPINLVPQDYHVYKVIDRRVENGAIVIRLEYMESETRDLARSALEAWDTRVGRVDRESRNYICKPLILDSIDDLRIMLVDPQTAQFGASVSSIQTMLPPGDLVKIPIAKKKERKRSLSAGVERRVRIIDTMTAAERRHPETLIDQLTRARIAEESGVSRYEVDQLLSVFEALKARSASPSNFENLTRKRTPLELPELSDLSALPVRACIALAVRCALRACLQFGPGDEEVREAIQQAVAVAAEYAAGNAIDSDDLHELSARLWLADRLRWPDGEETPGRHAVAAAFWATIDTSFAVMFSKTGRRKSTASQSGARWAAVESIAADERNKSGILADSQLLRLAVERGEVVEGTPVPQSFFPAIAESPPGSSPPIQP